MSKTLVIRFSSLGDLCLLGRVLAQRRDNLAASEHEHITLVTKPAYVELMKAMRGVDTILAPRDGTTTEVARLAKSLRAQNYTTIVDAHNVLRSHLLLGLMGRRADRRLAKDTASRLLFLGTGKRTAALNRTMIDRFGDILLPAAKDHQVPWSYLPPLADLCHQPLPEPGILGLAPGAQWASKRWPPEYFATLAHGFLKQTAASIRIFLGPGEQEWFPLSPLADMGQHARIEIIQNQPLVKVARALGECHTLVTNDSGLLHLAEVCGTPVLALFGPTVREFGYFPQLPQSRVMEISLDCRPCSRNGKRPCHRGDLACLINIQPDRVVKVLAAMWSAHPPEANP